ncbi:MAG: hypothetical protein J5I93_20155 [Pirellulaceae bacterium]|nr:hypothetical protein [Pirellulaceae bacterium]
MDHPAAFEIGQRVQVPTPRSALFRRRAASQDRVAGTIVGLEDGVTGRRPTHEWWYFVKLTWDEPWIEIPQSELLRLNPRNGEAAD